MTHRNILIEKHNSIYFFIPKAGSTSIKTHLAIVFGMDKIQNFPIGIHKPKLYPFPYVKQANLHIDYHDFFRFTIVRNPWSRLVSCYKDKIHPAGYNDIGVINGVASPLLNCSNKFYGGMSFDAFANVVCSIPDIDANHHFRSQLFQLIDDKGKLMVNYIGKLETLRESLGEISQKTGIPLNQIPHLHQTSSKLYWEYYDDVLREKVKQRYKTEIDFFNYEFNPTRKTCSLGPIGEKKIAELNKSDYVANVIKDKSAKQKLEHNKTKVQPLSNWNRTVQRLINFSK